MPKTKKKLIKKTGKKMPAKKGAGKKKGFNAGKFNSMKKKVFGIT